MSSFAGRLACGLLTIAFGIGCTERPEGPVEVPTTSPPEVTAADDIFVKADEGDFEFVHFNGMSGGFYTAEVTAGGCGVLDYDNDGDLDLYLTQGNVLDPEATLADALFPPADGRAPVDRLFRNDLDPTTGAARFVDVTESSRIGDGGYGMGVAAADYDGDGWTDLYVTNLGPNKLYRNRGDGTFSDETERAGAGDDRWSVPAVFFDYDLDGWLDLFVGNYVEFSHDDPKTCFRVTGARDYCGPLAYPEAPDRLLRNQGDGTFRDVTRAAGLTAAYGSALGAVVADFDGDGRPDLYVANDGRPNQLWINGPDGRFEDEALLRGSAVNAEGFAEASMGVEAADFDGDGDEDLFMTHLLGETNTVYLNDGQGMFEDASIQTGLGTPSKWATGFGTVTLDYDNDGWLDLMTVNGEVRIIEEQARESVPFPLRQPNQLFHNDGGGRFSEVTEHAGDGFDELEVSRGAAVGDLDNDGDSDVLVLNNNGPARLLLNQVGSHHHWIGLRLVGGAGERDMLGTRVAVLRDGSPPLWRRVRTDGSFASSNDPRVLFGLGQDGGPVRVRAHWPDGSVESWSDVAIDRYTRLVQGTGRPVSEP